MNKKLQRLKYLLSDFLSGMSAWSLFYIFRKISIESQKYGYKIPIELDSKFYLGLAIIPLFWILLYYLTGYYKNIYRKSRLKELGNTIYCSFIGVIIIFFVLILDDTVSSYKNYYLSASFLLSVHFFLTYIPRFIITNTTIGKIRKGKIGFNTLIIGSNKKAMKLYDEYVCKPKSNGFKFVGFANVHKYVSNKLRKRIKHLGSFNDLEEIISLNKIEIVIIAIESSEHEEVWRIINKLQGQKVQIKVIPNMYDILSGSVNISTIFGEPLIEISHDLMPEWEANVKRMIDIFASTLALIVFSPLYLFLAIGVKLSSPGPIFYSHERIGKYGKPFTIYKYRSMYVDAEKNGPALSSSNDTRITPFGKFMRKSRLDEFPQFFNVLRGDMSLVGPRPERQFYIDKIMERAPHYSHLQKVRPGITSWGQVRYGYAENVDEMIERLKYDLIYIENMSLYADLKIMIYTIKTVLNASGK